MEDNLIVAEADTQPEVETEETAPAAETEGTTETDGAEENTLFPDTEDFLAEAPAAPTDDEQLITVKYNKQFRPLSREEAVNYAQKGMKYDTVAPLLDSLKYVAASEGRTLTELVGDIRKQHDEALFDSLLERCGDEDIARELLEVERDKHRAAYETALKRERDEEKATEEAVTARLADEFSVLRGEFPQYAEFSKVPVSVVREAVEKGITLLDAQLRYEHRERAKAERARAAQTTAAKQSTGSQMSAGGNVMSSVEAAMMKGLWG